MMWVSKQAFLERFVTKKEFNRFEKRIDKRIGRLELGMLIVSAMSLISVMLEIIRFVGGE